MKNYYLPVLFFYLVLLIVPSFSQEIKINEVMSSNNTSITDEDGENSDWLELYNSGTTAVNLTGYGLSDNISTPFKWTFPNVSVPAGGYLVVWASGKDKIENGASLHTNFSISAAGEIILLSNPLGIIVDQIDSIQIPTDVSYGRKPGEESLNYFSTSTPGAANSSESYSTVLSAPVFSHTGGVYPAAFNLTITSTDPDATIIYTLDGSEPDPSNIQGTTYSYKNTYPDGQLLKSSYKSNNYIAPIQIENRTASADSMTGKSSTFDRVPFYIPDTPVYKGMVVRARAFKDGAMAGPVATNTYFVNTANRYTLPVVSMSLSEDLFFDYEKGIYTAGKDFDDWRAANRFARADGATPANYQRTTEYPAHIEIFETDQQRVLSQDIGFRLHGGHSRVHPQKSIRLYSRSEYGKSDMNYAFFPDQPYDSYNRMLLRNSGNDWNYTLFRDASIQSIMAHMNFETQSFRPAILFINAEYWGIQSFTERYDKHYFERKYKIDPENIDYLTINAHLEVEEGDSLHYKETLSYIEENGLSEKTHYDYIQTRIDVENFMDYQIAQIFVGNADWPANNVKMWRTRNEYNPTAGKGKDGRWQWLMYDTDYSLGIYGGSFTRDNLSFATSTNGPSWPNPPWSTFLLRKFLENENFKNDFINRFTDQLNSSFKPEVTTAKINAIKQIIAPEIEEHIERWKQPDTLEAWEAHVEVMLNYVTERPAYQREHLRDFFNLGNDYQLTVNVADTKQGHVVVNKLALAKGTVGIPANIYPWSGTYFAGLPIQLLAVPAPGYKFKGWVGAIDSITPQVTITPNGDISVEAIFEKKPETAVLHYWNFNNIEDLTKVSYTVSGGLLETKISEGISSEFVNATGNGFFGENANFDDAAGSHLRINNPIPTILNFSLPTTGYSQIVFQYETKRSAQGAAEQVIEYTLDGTSYIEKEVIMVFEDVPALYTIDFSEIAGVDNNENFAIRIKFSQGNGGGIAGNNRIDNASLRGVPMEANAVRKGNASGIIVESYPNPFQNESLLKVTLPNSSDLKITLSDMKGNIWYEVPEKSMPAGTHEVSINTSRLIPGIYFIICTSSESQSQLKMVKY